MNKKEQVSKANFQINKSQCGMKELLPVLTQKLSGQTGFKYGNVMSQLLFSDNVKIHFKDKELDIRITSGTRRPLDPRQQRMLETLSVSDLISLMMARCGNEENKK